MKLYTLRHGQTKMNKRDLIVGRTDDELTQEGMKQAECIAEKIALFSEKCIPNIIIASPLQRAKKTAEIVAKKLAIEVMYDDRLIEQDYGSFEATSRLSEAFLNSKKQFVKRLPEGGESMFDLVGRVYPFLNEIHQKYADKNVLLVTHGGILRIIRTYFLTMENEEFSSYRALNCQLDEYEWS